MLAAIEAFVLAANIVAGTPVDSENSGLMTEIVVTAPRYEREDAAYSGMMEEVVVSAPRLIEDDLGMIPEVLVTADRNVWTIADLELIRFIRQELARRSFNRFYLIGFQSRSMELYN
jgi:hypothetical protein